METKHTPGPWTIEEYGGDDCPALVIHKDSETRVCFMATPGSKGDPQKIEADARLIAAAPDMLAALQKLLRKFENCARAFGNDDDVIADATEFARDAIAKATLA